MDKFESPLKINGFSKKYGDVYGVKNLNIKVKKGEVFGFLGANGAGKSTTIRSILNFIKPTEGSIQIFGMDSVENSTDIKHRVGYLAGDIALYPNRKAKAVIEYLANLNRIEDTAFIKDLAVKLKAELDKPIRKLSKGNKQKIGLIIAFMQKPDLLVLDEPTSGLDPLMKNIFYDLIDEMKAEGKTVFVSSHDLSEVQRICDRAAFIRKGELLSIDDLKDSSKLKVRKYEFTLKSDIKDLDLSSFSNVIESSIHKNLLKITVSGDLEGLINKLTGFGIQDIDEIETSLEDLFLQYYK